jgi:hypothetical protein
MRKAVCINTDGDVSRKHGVRGSRSANLFALPAKGSQWRLLKLLKRTQFSGGPRVKAVK